MATDRLPASLRRGLRLPVIAAPMFLVSGSSLVVAACRAGVIGSFPAANGRTADDFDRMCREIVLGLGSRPSAPWAVNLITHSSYTRLGAELEVLDRHRPELVISSLGRPDRVLEVVHAYGGTVFADVSTPRHAEKAIAAGVDGLVLIAAGAGGHTGQYNGFALVGEIRRFWDGPLVLGGGVGTGAAVLATQAVGADLAYVGTRFLATRESLAPEPHRRMLVESTLADIVLSDAVTGIPANWLRASYDVARLGPPADGIDFSGDIASRSKAWKDVWSAGHVAGAVEAVLPVAEVVEQLSSGYAEAVSGLRRATTGWPATTAASDERHFQRSS